MLPLGNSPPALLQTLCPGSLAAVWSSGASSNLLEGRAGRSQPPGASLQLFIMLCLHGCCSHLLDPFCPSQLCVWGAQRTVHLGFQLGELELLAASGHHNSGSQFLLPGTTKSTDGTQIGFAGQTQPDSEIRLEPKQ